MSDRQIHAYFTDPMNSDTIVEIVRYDRAGKYYLESHSKTTPGVQQGRSQITLSQAVTTAMANHAEINWLCPGGTRFRAALRKAQSNA